MTRRYSSTSTETTLAAELSAIATTMTVAAGTASALLNGVSLTAGNVDQFTIAIDPDTASEEIVFVTNVSSNVLTIVRARAGTSGIIHLTGANVRHVLTSDDLIYFTTGVDSAVTLTGTQTLTNKTLTAPVISTISNTGTVTLPTSTDTLVGRATTDTLTNKTLTSPTITLNVATNTAGNYTFILTDASKLIISSYASAHNIYIPTNASVAFPIGTQITVVWDNNGVGQPTILASNSGTTNVVSIVASASSPKLKTNSALAICTKIKTDTWVVSGDII